MTSQSLGNITEHPKIAINKDEYDRIQKNLKYYQSKWDPIRYRNSNRVDKQRTRNHLPIARTACKKIASLVFNEQAEISVANGTTNEFIQSVLLNDRFNKNFERYLESCLALGGLAMRPYVDDDKIKISFVQAPVFYPLQSNTQDVSSAAIINKSQKTVGKETVYYTLVELHEWTKDKKYTITNELYRSNEKERVGDRVPLSDVYEDLEEEVTLDGLTRPLFTYLKPPGMNNKDINSPLGLSIFDNAKSTIDFINTTYDEFKWEVRMGQRRVLVPDQTVRIGFDHHGDTDLVTREFDPEQNVYEQIDGGKDTPINITDLTTPIRSDDYIKAINEGLALFEMQVGVSPGMFTFDGKSMKTATEVVSENSDTYQLRNSIVSLVDQSIKELVISICEIGKLYGLYSGPIPDMDDITVNLDDGVFVDKNNELDYYAKALLSGLVSKQYAISKALGLSDDEAAQMLEDIKKETAESMELERSTSEVDIYGE